MALRRICLVALASVSYAQLQTLYGQCGGINYSGPTRCAAQPTHATCQSVNPWYYQCTPSSPQGSPPPPTSTTSMPTTSTLLPTNTAPLPSKRVPFAGVNIAGCDFGCDISGNCNSVYCPSSVGPTQMQHFARDDKLNIFRLPVGWQYLVNYKLGGTLDPSFFATYDNLVQACLGTGAKCVIDVHNYARWYGGIIGQGGPSNDEFVSLWSQLAKKYVKQPNVVFGIMNEPHNLSMQAWATTVQAVVSAIRKAGATRHWILLPGTGYSSAQAFVSDSAPYLSKIKNPNGTTRGLIYDVHRYYDGDGSGQSTECVTDHIQDTFAPLATYLRANKRQAILTETGGGNTQSCVDRVCSALSYLNQNNDVYLGWVGWAAGNFDQNYALSEVPNGSKDTLLVQQCIAGKFK